VSSVERGIHPKVQEAADNLRKAFQDMQKAQDPRLRNVLLKEVWEQLANATVIAAAAEIIDDLGGHSHSNN
jgi:hypothetical protein